MELPFGRRQPSLRAADPPVWRLSSVPATATALSSLSFMIDLPRLVDWPGQEIERGTRRYPPDGALSMRLRTFGFHEPLVHKPGGLLSGAHELAWDGSRSRRVTAQP